MTLLKGKPPRHKNVDEFNDIEISISFEKARQDKNQRQNIHQHKVSTERLRHLARIMNNVN